MTYQSPRATIETWHRRLGHRLLDAVSESVKSLSDKVTDLKISDTREGLISICGVCAIGRQHNQIDTGTREKATEILNIIDCDLCGRMQTPTHTRETYFLTFIDEASGHVSISLLKPKDAALATFQGYQARAEKAPLKEIQSAPTGRGGEYMSKKFGKYLTDSGIQHIVSPANTPTQNARAEGKNWTIMESTQCLLDDSKLGQELWGYAVLMAGHVYNRLPSRSHHNISYLQHWTGKVPSIGHLRIFGSTAGVHVPREKRQKLEPKSIKDILVGCEEDAGSRVYRVYDVARKRLLLSEDVIIDETQVVVPNTLASG